MAIIMTSCCCFDTVEKGTIATAIYAMLTSIIAFGWVTYRIQPLEMVFQEMEGSQEIHLQAIYVSYIVAIVLTVSLVASAMVLLVGTLKGIRFCMVPYLIVILITIVLQVPFSVFLLWHFIHTNYVNLMVLVHLLFVIPLICLNIASFFCVIARFQQLCEMDGSETSTDVESIEEAKIDIKFVHRESQHLTVLKKHTYV
ncbi:uncharacterized protein [Diadema antillarum]|uniref:uncharacterized protein n=1 Tax=Diadema antillarum TaxID=105358 RepID=UPI003A87B5BD